MLEFLGIVKIAFCLRCSIRHLKTVARQTESNCQTQRCLTCTAKHRIEKMCRETLEGLIAMSLEVVKYRAYSEHRREPDASAPHQDPMPSLQWKDMKWSFVRCGYRALYDELLSVSEVMELAAFLSA